MSFAVAVSLSSCHAQLPMAGTSVQTHTSTRLHEMTSLPSGKGTKLPFGTLHPDLQQFDAFEFKETSPTASSPASAKVDPTDIATWVQQWPSSSRAFYTPRLMSAGQSVCPRLTYGDLNEQMEQCPPWR